MQVQATSLSFLLVVFVFTTASCQHSEVRTPAAANEKTDGLTLYHQYFDPICKHGFSEEVSLAQSKVIAEQMAGRDHRIWHYFWHATRNSWHQLTEEQKSFFLSFDSRWKPERLLGEPEGLQILNHDIYNPEKNDAGEDFLFMHHQMMTELSRQFAAQGLPCIAPWKTLPPKDDKLWPVTGNPEAPKDDESYKKMESWRARFTSPTYLASKSLGEIGYNLELSLHNNMHMRWTTDNPPKGYENRPDITPDNLKTKLKKFDNPKYKWLADPYSAHVNEVFWKLHGLVETVIFSWMQGNQYSMTAVQCEGQASCYQWKGTWVGAAPIHASDVVKGPGPEQGHGSGHGTVAARGAPAPSFEKSFEDSFNQFINGSNAKGRDPGGPVGGGAPVTAQEKNRRRRVVLEALKKLNENSPMKRGALNPDLIKETSSSLYDDPQEYVRLIEAKEKSAPRSK
jgi:hypothetical protein